MSRELKIFFFFKIPEQFVGHRILFERIRLCFLRYEWLVRHIRWMRVRRMVFFLQRHTQNIHHQRTDPEQKYYVFECESCVFCAESERMINSMQNNWERMREREKHRNRIRKWRDDRKASTTKRRKQIGNHNLPHHLLLQITWKITYELCPCATAFSVCMCIWVCVCVWENAAHVCVYSIDSIAFHWIISVCVFYRKPIEIVSRMCGGVFVMHIPKDFIN